MTDVPAQLRRADVMLGAGRFAEAIALIAPVVAAEPDNSRAWALLAQAQLGAGNPADGLTAADRAVQLDPASAWPHRLRSIAQRRTGRDAAAMESAAEACRLEPHHWMNHVNLAQAALGASGHGGPGAAPDGQPSLAAARHASETARELAPNEPSVHYLSGQVSRAYGDKDGARLHFERTLALDPEHCSAINELGRLRLERGQSAAAAEHFIQAARIAPGQSVYGHNVDIAVARAERSVRALVRWVIYGSWLALIIALGLAHRSLADRLALPAVLVVAAAAVAGAWQLQLRRMPRQARPLFQGRSILLALAVSLSSMLAGVAAVEFLPGQFGNYLLLIVIFMLAARFAAFKILRDGARRRYEQITGRSAAART
jgi:tetratricopeptide (TPR) repeat protein